MLDLATQYQFNFACLTLSLTYVVVDCSSLSEEAYGVHDWELVGFLPAVQDYDAPREPCISHDQVIGVFCTITEPVELFGCSSGEGCSGPGTGTGKPAPIDTRASTPVVCFCWAATMLQ